MVKKYAEPVSRTDVAESEGLRALVEGRKASTVRRPSATVSKRRALMQDGEAGEVLPRKRVAQAKAREKGHTLRGWHRRKNDPAGRWNAYCNDCNKIAIVCTEHVDDFPMIYGDALSEKCR